MKGKIFRIMLLASFFIPLSCKENIKDFKVNSCKVVRVEPHGLRSIKLYLDMNIHNPVIGFTLQSPTGTVKLEGEACVELSSNDIVLDKRGDSQVLVCVEGNVVKGVSPITLISMIGKGNFDAFTADVNTRVKLNGGLGKKIALKDLPLGKLLKK